MKKNRRIIAAAIIGIILVALSLIIFFLAVSHPQTLHITGLVFILLAEIIAFCGFIALESYANSSPGLLIRSGVYNVLFIYAAAAVSASLIFFAASGRAKWLVLIQLILLAAAAILFILILTAGKTINDHNQKTMASVKKLSEMENMLAGLKDNPKHDRFKEPLTKIYEGIEYCDNSLLLPSDAPLFDKIDELEKALNTPEEIEDEKIFALTNEILSLTQKRALETKECKRGRC